MDVYCHYAPGGWVVESPSGSAWNEDGVVSAQSAHWPAIVRNLEGTGPLGVAHLPDRLTREHFGDHNVMMSYGYVLARAARNKERLSVLDWGGSLGHYFLYSQVLLPEVTFDYHCYEVPSLSRAGRQLQPEVHFHEGADTLDGAIFDLVVCSGTLYYLERWQEVAGLLARRAGEYLYITRVMTVEHVPSFVVLQRSRHYGTQFPSWSLNRRELIGCVEGQGMELLREFVFDETRFVDHAPEQSACRGFLFRRA
ncbi:MAG TPA: methyltransferase, TIGR04325 family [bacterium]|nr:methyltransferase, TIGR04325 family [bacterium]